MPYQYEYKIKVFRQEEVDKGTIEAYLNTLGREGWRVVGVVMEQQSAFSDAALIYTFERNS